MTTTDNRCSDCKLGEHAHCDGTRWVTEENGSSYPIMYSQPCECECQNDKEAA